MRGTHRSPDDDFFCEKYQVWYPMRDCNFRVAHATFEGCIDCFQGRVNLRAGAPPSSPAEAADARILVFPTPEAEDPPTEQEPGMIPG